MNQLSTYALPTAQIPCKRVVRLDAGVTYIYRLDGSFYNPDELNSACENFYFIGEVASASSVKDLSTVHDPASATAAVNVITAENKPVDYLKIYDTEKSSSNDMLCFWNSLFGADSNTSQTFCFSGGSVSSQQGEGQSSSVSAQTNIEVELDKLTLEAMSELMVHLLNEPAFDQLRTKEQLGYIVHSSLKKVNLCACVHVIVVFTRIINFIYIFIDQYFNTNYCVDCKLGSVYGIHIIVQSNHQGPDYLNDRIETFLQTYRATLSAMTAEEFQHNIDAVVENLTEKPKNLDDEARRHVEEIRSGCYLFSRRYMLAKLLRNDQNPINLPHILKFYDQFILSTTKRKKFSSRFTGSAVTAAAATPADTVNTPVAVVEEDDQVLVKDYDKHVVEIKNHTLFKKYMSLLPITRSVI